MQLLFSILIFLIITTAVAFFYSDNNTKPTSVVEEVTWNEGSNVIAAVPESSPAVASKEEGLQIPKVKKKYIALTFDDGPNDKTTNEILDILEDNEAKATFFVIGVHIKNGKKALKRASNMGCTIGNHTMNHLNLQLQNRKTIRQQILSTKDKVEKITKKKMRLVRLPFGSVNDRVARAVKNPMIMWSIDTEDWKAKNYKKIYRKVKNNVQDGDIINFRFNV
jgi:peptidoglycan/xylan/chitin deacetylase (PgdA/CDA1 family)